MNRILVSDRLFGYVTGVVSHVSALQSIEFERLDLDMCNALSCEVFKSPFLLALPGHLCIYS